MWHREDGGEDPGENGAEDDPSGLLPDPGTRHWRHPSELARDHALPNPDPTPLTTGPLRGSPPLVWPLMAVGGCLAVAAAGVLTLQTALVTPSAVQTGGTTTLPDQAIGLPSVPGGRVGSAVEMTRPISTLLDPAPLIETSTTITIPPRELWELATSRRSSAIPDPPVGRDPGDARAEAVTAPVYGVYVEAGDEDGLLASFVVVDGELVTSATALEGRSPVWIRSGSEWIEATVVGVDPLTDLALLDPVDTPWATLSSLPALQPAVAAVEAGDAVMIGYGDPGHEVDTDHDPGLAEPAGELLWADAGDRRGKVYAIGPAVATPGNHLIDDPIRVAIDPRPGDAGAPLRGRDGSMVGVAVASDSPLVIAVPVSDVVDTVAALRRIGAGDDTWLGLEVAGDERGLVIRKVSEGSPAEELRTGDVIVAIDGKAVSHPDEIQHAAREAGPGGNLVVTIERWGRRGAVDVGVDSRPVEDR